ncbi:MAG: DUF2723 domain-containing protein, partial [Anaerolineae bacterium]|nr:DUF2723 domain-containing protein [Anaerolineae bacterium]
MDDERSSSVLGAFGYADLIIVALILIAAIGLYVRTLAPGLLPGDSGEFQVLAYQVGIAHTTGYPVYMVLVKLFITVLPIRDIAYRVNLFSAAMAALTLATLYILIRILVQNRWAAVYGTVILMVSYTFWSQAIIAEVYTPGAFFIALVLLGLLLWHAAGKRWGIYMAAIVGGLGLGVHASLGLLALAIIPFLLSNRERWTEIWQPALFGGSAGFLLYLGVFF